MSPRSRCRSPRTSLADPSPRRPIRQSIIRAVDAAWWSTLALEEAAGDLLPRRLLTRSSTLDGQPRGGVPRPRRLHPALGRRTTIVSPERTTTAPSACLASFPFFKKSPARRIQRNSALFSDAHLFLLPSKVSLRVRAPWAGLTKFHPNITRLLRRADSLIRFQSSPSILLLQVTPEAGSISRRASAAASSDPSRMTFNARSISSSPPSASMNTARRSGSTRPSSEWFPLRSLVRVTVRPPLRRIPVHEPSNCRGEPVLRRRAEVAVTDHRGYGRHAETVDAGIEILESSSVSADAASRQRWRSCVLRNAAWPEFFWPHPPHGPRGSSRPASTSSSPSRDSTPKPRV